MKATVYELSTNLHWHKVKVYKNITPELFKDLQAFAEYHQGQISIEYS